MTMGGGSVEIGKAVQYSHIDMIYTSDLRLHYSIVHKSLSKAWE